METKIAEVPENEIPNKETITTTSNSTIIKDTNDSTVSSDLTLPSDHILSTDLTLKLDSSISTAITERTNLFSARQFDVPEKNDLPTDLTQMGDCLFINKLTPKIELSTQTEFIKYSDFKAKETIERLGTPTETITEKSKIICKFNNEEERIKKKIQVY